MIKYLSQKIWHQYINGCIKHSSDFSIKSCACITLTANPTSTDGYKMTQTNQLLDYIQCPVCSHHRCDRTNTNLCEACKIAFDKWRLPHDTKCDTVRKILRIYAMIVTFLRLREGLR